MTPPFDTETPELFWDSALGFSSLHEDARAMLRWLCSYCFKERIARPLVICFGRDRAMEAERHLPEMMEKVQGVVSGNGRALETARRLAASRWTWHRRDANGKVRAFDVGAQRVSGDKIVTVYSVEQCNRIIAAARGRFPLSEAALRDRGAPYLHFAACSPERPPAEGP